MLMQSFIRNGIVAFWAIWFAVVFAGNVCDGLKAATILPQQWPFASGNYAFMCGVTQPFHVPEALPVIMFAGVVAWEGIATVFFFRAAYLSWCKSNSARHATQSAFAIGLALRAAFAIADEVFIAYAVEATHMRLFTAQLVSLLYLALVSDD